jgi:hypothetical protein
MVELTDIKKKYKKFCFKDIHPNKDNFYLNKDECLKAMVNAETKIIENIGFSKFKKLFNVEKSIEFHKINKKIPMVDLDLYY